MNGRMRKKQREKKRKMSEYDEHDSEHENDKMIEDDVVEIEVARHDMAERHCLKMLRSLPAKIEQPERLLPRPCRHDPVTASRDEVHEERAHPRVVVHDEDVASPGGDRPGPRSGSACA